eukprot:TRINITY_DN8013_c0_g1_i1.p1 TRINITY_DN8013_c0_g1~~TRINITY_DN8013_c0_g1_i1.p1  ORF type:complete len:1033 (+),score=236.87 TRINITY_DN8013_c0_g1_i1:225-3101(+)
MYLWQCYPRKTTQPHIILLPDCIHPPTAQLIHVFPPKAAQSLSFGAYFACMPHGELIFQRDGRALVGGDVPLRSGERFCFLEALVGGEIILCTSLCRLWKVDIDMESDKFNYYEISSYSWLDFGKLFRGNETSFPCALRSDITDIKKDVVLLSSSKVQRWSFLSPQPQLVSESPLLHNLTNIISSKIGLIPEVELLDLAKDYRENIFYVLSVYELNGTAIYGIHTLLFHGNQVHIAESREIPHKQCDKNAKLLMNSSINRLSVFLVLPHTKSLLLANYYDKELVSRETMVEPLKNKFYGFGVRDTDCVLILERDGILKLKHKPIRPIHLDTPGKPAPVEVPRTPESHPPALNDYENVSPEKALVDAFNRYRSRVDGGAGGEENFPLPSFFKAFSPQLDALILDLLIKIVDNENMEDGLDVEKKLLEKKKQADYFFHFLNFVKIFEYLGLNVRLSVAELAEKVVSSLKLYQSLQNVRDISLKLKNDTITKVLNHRKLAIQKWDGVALEALFFSKVSRIGDFCEKLIETEEEYLAKDPLPLVKQCNIYLETIIGTAKSYRDSFINSYIPPDTLVPSWTFSLRAVLEKQCSICRDILSRKGNTKTDIYDQLFRLSDLLLGDYAMEVKCCPGNKQLGAKFQELSKVCIKPFLREDMRNKALELAEKYEEFSTLIQICERFDKPRLEKYLLQFMHKGFPQVLFQHYYNTRQISLLLNQPPVLWDQLSKFLEAHPTLQWIHSIETQDYNQTNHITSELGRSSNSIFLQRIYLSISQMAALTSETDPQTLTAETHLLNMISYQERLKELPPSLLKGVNIDKPMTFQELINLFLGRKLDGSPNLDGSPTLRSIQLALGVWGETTSERGSEDNINLVVGIFGTCISLGTGKPSPRAQWADVMKLAEENRLSQKEFQEIVQQSPIFQLATSAEGKTLFQNEKFIYQLKTTLSTKDQVILDNVVFLTKK